MVENYWDGWKEEKEVEIPPVQKKGFKEDVIIRKKVNPVVLERPQEEKTKILIR